MTRLLPALLLALLPLARAEQIVILGDSLSKEYEFEFHFELTAEADYDTETIP